MTVPIAVLASGSGTNFEAIHDAVRDGRLDARIVAVLSDRPEAPVLAKAKARGLPAVSVPFAKGSRREEHEEKILEALRPYSPRFLVLAGYMRIMTSRLIDAFKTERGYSRIVNIHPSLLPSFPGVGGYAQAFEYGAKVAGATVHLVTPGVDEGPICAQEAFSIESCRSAGEVEEMGKRIEHQLYPRTLSWVLSESFHLAGRRQIVRPI